jgi:hypothetical protein
MFSIRTYMTMLKHVQVLIPCNLGRTHWVLARVNLMEGRIYLLDPYRQSVSWEHRRQQISHLRYFIPSMLHQIDFHGSRKPKDETYPDSKSAFRMTIMAGKQGVPQQDQGYVFLNTLFYPIIM